MGADREESLPGDGDGFEGCGGGGGVSGELEFGGGYCGILECGGRDDNFISR